MRLFEIMTPRDFWDDARHMSFPGAAQSIEQWFAGQRFGSEQQARAFVLTTLRKHHASRLAPVGDNEARIAAAAPIYFDGQSWRIGTREQQPKITWTEIEIGSESRRDIVISADAHAESWECDWKVHWFDCAELLPDPSNDVYAQDPAEVRRIEALAAAIRENREFTPIFVAEQEDDDERIQRYVMEGQHRTRAVYRILGLKKVPGYRIEIFD